MLSLLLSSSIILLVYFLLFHLFFLFFFFFNDTATTEIYTLSLHDALPISCVLGSLRCPWNQLAQRSSTLCLPRSEEHTSELQSQSNLVCRLLLEKKKKKKKKNNKHYKENTKKHQQYHI